MHFAWKTTIAIAVAALMSAPATAEWYAFGNFEPSTTYDQSTMFVDPPNATESRVYFHVVTGTQEPLATFNGDPGGNPNVGLLRTQIEPAAIEYHDAFLGVWKDCNGDGYVGRAESALREYPSVLLTETDACPGVTADPKGPWTPGAHNYNGWVTEFIPIVKDASNAIDRRAYRDGDARVWGDFHRPDEDPFHRSCTLTPFARGTTQDTGGFVNYVDCRVDVLGNFNILVDSFGDPLGLRFSDEDDGHTGTLGRVDIFGPEDDRHSPATVWDCSGGPAFRSGDELNETPLGPSVPSSGHNIEVYPVDPAPGNLDRPTLAGLANHTIEGTEDCDTSNDFGHDASDAFEADFNGVNPKNKTEADWNFGNGGTARGAPVGPAAVPGWGGFGGAPNDAGIASGGYHWTSDSVWLSKPGPRTVRVDLANGGVTIAPAYWLSFYAHVSANVTSRFQLPPGAGVYGSWHCGDNDSGIHHGWNCDPAVWYINPDQTTFHPNKANFAHPGWTYQLRDVDCYDGRIGDSGLSVQPAFYGTEPCIPVS